MSLYWCLGFFSFSSFVFPSFTFSSVLELNSLLFAAGRWECVKLSNFTCTLSKNPLHLHLFDTSQDFEKMKFFLYVILLLSQCFKKDWMSSSKQYAFKVSSRSISNLFGPLCVVSKYKSTLWKSWVSEKQNWISCLYSYFFPLSCMNICLSRKKNCKTNCWVQIKFHCTEFSQ